MKKQVFALLISLLLAVPAAAEPPADRPPLPTTPNGQPVLGDVGTTWPGVHFWVSTIKRIPQNRLLVVVWIVGTAGTPPGGIGLALPNPAKPLPGLTPQQILAMYPRLPFSLMPSTMVDDLSQQSYSTLPAVAPPGRAYRPPTTRTALRPGDNVILTIQFPAPPPPPPPPPGKPPIIQTVTFHFPKAIGPISNVPLPPVPGAPKP